MAEELEELSQEEVFSNDIDPLDAIREIRKSEGVPEEDLPVVEEPRAEVVEESSDQSDLDDIVGDVEPDTAEAPDDGLQGGPNGEGVPTEEDAEGEGDATGDPVGEDPKAEKLPGEGKDPGEAAPITKKFRANGQDFEFTQEEVDAQFETVFGQAMDYTQKMQKIAPYRKMISALESEGLTEEQLNVAIDALKGDKGAIQSIMKANEIETYDLDSDPEDEPYSPTVYGKDETQMGIEEVASKISGDEEYKITVDVVDNQWDSKSRQAFASNPDMILGLHNDIKTGVFDKVAPVAMKMKVLDGNTKSDIEYYMLAGQQVTQQQSAQTEVDETNKKTQDAVNKSDTASSEAQRKRSAAPTRGRADRKGVIDYLDDDDEDFDAWYKNLQARN